MGWNQVQLEAGSWSLLLFFASFAPLRESSPYIKTLSRKGAKLAKLDPERRHYFKVLLADTTRIIASPEGPTLSVPTITGSPSRMLMSVLSPVLS